MKAAGTTSFVAIIFPAGALQLAVLLLLLPTSRSAIFVKIPGVPGESTSVSDNGVDDDCDFSGDWFRADTASVEVEKNVYRQDLGPVRGGKHRSVRENGRVEVEHTANSARGVIDDENIVDVQGQQRMVNITKRVDKSSPLLAQLAAGGDGDNDGSLPTCEICFTSAVEDGREACQYHVAVGRCRMGGWIIHGDAGGVLSERFSIYYDQIAFQVYSAKAQDQPWSKPMSWDFTENRQWKEGGALVGGGHVTVLKRCGRVRRGMQGYEITGELDR